MNHESKILLDANKITKTYGENEVLKGISLKVHAGEVIALIWAQVVPGRAPSSGASTTLSAPRMVGSRSTGKKSLPTRSIPQLRNS